MTLPQLRVTAVEGIGRLLHHSLLISAEDREILQGCKVVLANDDDVLQKVYDQLPPSMKE